MSWAKPRPSSPRILVIGTRTSSKNSSDVSCALIADLFEIAATAKTFAIPLNEDQTDPLGAFLRIGLTGEDDKIGQLAVRDEDLLAVDDEVIAVSNRRAS